MGLTADLIRIPVPQRIVYATFSQLRNAIPRLVFGIESLH